MGLSFQQQFANKRMAKAARRDPLPGRIKTGPTPFTREMRSNSAGDTRFVRSANPTPARARQSNPCSNPNGCSASNPVAVVPGGVSAAIAARPGNQFSYFGWPAWNGWSAWNWPWGAVNACPPGYRRTRSGLCRPAVSYTWPSWWGGWNGGWGGGSIRPIVRVGGVPVASAGVVV